MIIHKGYWATSAISVLILAALLLLTSKIVTRKDRDETGSWEAKSIRKGEVGFVFLFPHMAVCQNLVPLVNIKIAGKWMFIPLKMVLIGIDP